MSQVKSPVTGTNNVEKIRSINVQKLISGYKNAFGTDVSHFVNNKDISVYRCLDSDLLFYEPRDAAGDGGFYNELSRFDWYYEENKWEFDQALEFITSYDRVLAIGSGEGAFLEKASKICKEAIGLELNEDAIEVSKAKGLSVEKRTVQDFVRENGLFDVVCSFQVMEHVEDVKGILDASIKLLKKDGVLIISVPNNSGYLKNLEFSLLNMPPHHLNLWTVDSFRTLEFFFPIKLDSMRFEPLRQDHVSGFVASISKELTSSNLIIKLLYKMFMRKKLHNGVDSLRSSINGITLFTVFRRQDQNN